MTYNLRALDVRHLLQEATDANQGYAETLDISLCCDLPESEPVFVNGDEARLMQVLNNIISNALKFSHAGGQVCVGYRTAGTTVRISVKDNGVGIPQGSREMVFDQFTQIDGSDQRQVGGTGLGMNISRQIVEQHGGQIDYVSTLGEGTTFFVDLDLLELPELDFAC